MLESTFAVVDIFFVAQLGASAVAAVGLTETYLFLLYSIAMGLSMAVTAIVARRIGERRGEEAALSAVQAIVVAVDAKAVTPDNDRWEVFTHGGRKPTGLDAVEWARKMQELGAGEILLTSMDRDGTRIGFNLALTRAVSDAVDIPVIASGGVGNLQHLVDGIKEGHADAVLAASIFHFGDYTVRQAKELMQSQGIEVRL